MTWCAIFGVARLTPVISGKTYAAVNFGPEGLRLNACLTEHMSPKDDELCAAIFFFFFS